MRVLRCQRVIFAVLALGGIALGGVRTATAGSRPRLVTPPRALGQLIPTDAVALIYLRSVDEAEKCIRELQRAGGGKDSLGFDAVGWLTRATEVRPARVDRRRPLAIAVSLGGLGQPLQTTTIVPLADRQGFELDRKWIPASMTVVVKGNYAGISPLPGYAAGHRTPAFATKLLDSPITARLRPHAVAPLARFLAEAGLGHAMADKCPESRPEGTVLPDSVAEWCARLKAAQSAVRGVCDAMDALETVDFGLTADHGVASLGYTITPLRGRHGILPTGAQAGSTIDLARCLSREFPAVAFVALDFARLADFMAPLSAAMSGTLDGRLPSPWREPMRALQSTGLELQRAINGGTLGAMGYGPRGLEWVRIFGMENAEHVAARHRDEFLSTFTGLPGFQLTSDPVSSLDGTPVSTYRLRLDLTQMPAGAGADSAAVARVSAELKRVTTQLLGNDEAVFRIAAVHDKLLAVGEPDPALLGEILAAAQQSPAPMPGWLKPALASPPDTLCWYAHADLRTVLQPLAALAGADTLDAPRAQALAALRDAPPAPVTLRGTVGRGIYRGELRADVAGLRAVFAALKPLLPARAGRHAAEPTQGP